MTKKEKEILKKHVKEAWEKLLECEAKILKEKGMTTESNVYVVSRILERSEEYKNKLHIWALLDDLATELGFKNIEWL